MHNISEISSNKYVPDVEEITNLSGGVLLVG